MTAKSVFYLSLMLNTILCGTSTARSIAKDGEIEVNLQFLEYELEDFCNSRNEAEWKFLNGSESDLKKFLDIELKESNFYKNELEVIQKHKGKKFSNEKLQRLMDLFAHPGAPLLGSMEFREYRDYTLKLQELMGTLKTECPIQENDLLSNDTDNSNSESCNPIDKKKIKKILYTEKDEGKLKDVWTKWYRTLEERNKKTKYDFVQQLSILDLEAEQNGEEELTDYWLKQSDTTWVNYETLKSIWNEILPLYEKLRQYMLSLAMEKFGENEIFKEKLIPAHILGTLESYDWMTAAEKLGAFDNSDIYKALSSSLKEKNGEDLYRMADNETAEMRIGNLPQSFYKKSRFHESSQTCQNKIMDYCERENVVRAMFCAEEVPNVKNYVAINENVMKIKYLLLSGREEEENGYLFREGPRESVLYEAVEGLSSLRALRPETLENLQLLANQTKHKQEMLSLLITALHVIPPLPYYLASDLWRINALREIDATVGENTADVSPAPYGSSTPDESENERKKREVTERVNNESSTTEEPQLNNSTSDANEGNKTYDTQNLSRDWWSYRRKFQGVGSPDGKLYEDYLQDIKIIWNKPYISKFLGKILQFQILEKTDNLTDFSNLQAIMRRGKSKSWQDLLEETFNITEISTKPLLMYFKPLEEFLDKGAKLKNQTQLFSYDDFNFVSQGFSLNPTNAEDEGEKPAEGSDALFFSLAVIAAVGVVGMIVTIGRRRYKKRQRARERKRRLAEL